MSKHAYLQRQYDVLVMAHRGASGHAPENTLPAFELAVEQGAEILELDIHATKEGALVVAHDPDVARMTGAEGNIRDYTLAELKRLDAGHEFTPDGGESYPYRGRGVTIPTVEEVFDAFPEMRINVDIKHHEATVVHAFAELIRAYRREELTLVGSFDELTVAQFRQRLPGVLTAATRRDVKWAYVLSKVGLGWLYRPGATAYQIPERGQGRHIVTPSFIRQVHRAGREVHVWTVNEKAEMRRLIEWGVDGIITNYPDRLLDVLGV